MASDAGFHDLELIMDHNVVRALSSSVPSLPNAAYNSASDHLPSQEDTVSQDEVFETPHPRAAAAAVSHHFPAGVASISLALGSVLSSSLVLTNSNRVLQAAASSSRGSSAQGSSAVFVSKAPPAAAVPSAKNSHNPLPVVASSQIQVALDIPVASPATAVKKDSKHVSAFPEYDRLQGHQFKNPGNAAGLRQASIVWFRNDLRVHDNEALVSANRDSSSILPVYCFDPRDYGKSSSGFDKTGPYRAKFLLECVANLRASLRERGSDLIVRVGNPEDMLVNLAKSVGASGLYVHQEVTHEEQESEEKVSAVLKDEGVETKYFWGSTLFHPDDLPFKLHEMPSNYGGFREKVQNVHVRKTIEAPRQLKGLPQQGGVKPGDIPSLQELGLNPTTALRQDNQTAGGAMLVGGEGEALKRLQRFALEVPGQVANQAKAFSGSKSEGGGDSLYGANFSCKISPWLAMGCLSPRRMFEDLKKDGPSKGGLSTVLVKAATTANDDNGLNWLVFELLWRDFFRFITKKYSSGKKIHEAVPATASLAAV
jgi:deoxyribodipyrimidine photolyase